MTVHAQRFAAVIMRIREPKTTALIFASGKMVCTGAKSEDDSKLAARKYCRIIQKLGFGAEFKVRLPMLLPLLLQGWEGCWVGCSARTACSL